MIRWPPNDGQLQSIIEGNDFTVPDYNESSFRGPQGYQVGRLGELVVMDWLTSRGVMFEEIFSTSFDLMVEGEKWEIKSKERTVDPKPYYDCTVPAYNHEHQQPAVFCFVSLRSTGKSDDINRFVDAHILGTIRLDDLTSRARYLTPESPPDFNGWVPTIACYNIRVEELDAP
jgi:hypothetical protein